MPHIIVAFFRHITSILAKMKIALALATLCLFATVQERVQPDALEDKMDKKQVPDKIKAEGEKNLCEKFKGLIVRGIGYFLESSYHHYFYLAYLFNRATSFWGHFKCLHLVS